MTGLRLHDYQRTAVAFLHNHPRGALFMDMGLGKTATVLTALTPEHLPALVVAPKRVAENVWPEERTLWRPDLSLTLVAGSPTQRQAALRQPTPDVTVISRDNLADALPHAGRWRTLVLDELSSFKTRNTNRWKTARTLIRKMDPYAVWGLTGTPTPNGLLDLWAQIFLLDGGERLGTGITHYRARYFSPGASLPSGVVVEWNLRPEAEQAIHRKLEDLALSISTDGRLDLPPVTHRRIEVPLPSDVRAAYRRMKQTLVADLREAGLGTTVHTAENAAVLSGKLAQISAGFVYADDAAYTDGSYTVLHREKVRAVREVVDGTGSPVIVAYRFRPELQMLEEELGPIAHRADRTPNLQQRWNAGELPVLLAHPASVGHGLNLQKGPGHTLVWASLTWSLEEWMQMNKRLVRQGQQQPVVIHHLASPGTLDDRIYEVLGGKRSVQDALLDHLESPL